MVEIVMAMDLIKRLERIRNYLTDKNFNTDDWLEEDIFIHGVMIVEGMTRKKALEWLYHFADVGLIEYKNWKVKIL